MEDEDEIDVLGEFSLDNILTSNDHNITSCYDGEHQLGLNCESSWILDSNQSCWFESKSEPPPLLEECTSTAINSIDASDSNVWSDKEKYLLEKGLELFGKSYSRLAQYIGTKSSSQVKAYVTSQKSVGLGWLGKSPASSSRIGNDGIDFNFTEIIHDIEIPASMEEVIAVVSTAQPTVIVPTAYREQTSTANPTLTRKKCRRRKHSKSCSKRSEVPINDSKEVTRIYKAEDIKGVLTDHKEQDSIVLPTGEQVIRMRHGSSVSEDSEVDIDANSEHDFKPSIDKDILTEDKDLPPVIVETTIPVLENCEEIKEELFEFHEDAVIDFSEIKDELFIPHVENEVSVMTESYIEENETQVFRGNLVTPSGKVMTVIVDDLSNSHHNTVLSNDKSNDSVPPTNTDTLLDTVYNLPPPTHEAELQTHIVTKEEQLLHPEFFDKNFHGLSRYMKIRNNIFECWKKSKPKYLSSTSLQEFPTFSMEKSEDVMLLNRIHAYLERKGCINFGCESPSIQTIDTNVALDDYSDQVCSVVEVDSSSADAENVFSEYTVPLTSDNMTLSENDKTFPDKKGLCGGSRVRKKKIPFEEVCESSAIKVPGKNSKGTTSRLKNLGPKSKSTLKRSRKQPSLKMSPLWKPSKSINNNSEGGYTMVHTTSGEVIVQHNQVRQPNKMLTRGIRPVRLIHCKNYVSKKAPYKVELEATVLLLVDIHSHLSPKCEVIGLLGGSHRPRDNVLTVTLAVPCRTVLSSHVHCDMCPVSQCESSELIASRGLSVVGWYHSHPNFDPSPSDTDVDTQNTLQSWFKDSGQPFVGLIISPYSPWHDVSFYRCCQVETEGKGPVPYQLEVKLINLYCNDGMGLRHLQPVEAAFKTLQTYEPIKQINVYKCLESAKYHLRKATPKVDEDKVSQFVKEIKDCIKEGFTSLVKKK